MSVIKVFGTDDKMRYILNDFIRKKIEQFWRAANKNQPTGFSYPVVSYILNERIF